MDGKKMSPTGRDLYGWPVYYYETPGDMPNAAILASPPALDKDGNPMPGSRVIVVHIDRAGRGRPYPYGLPWRGDPSMDKAPGPCWDWHPLLPPDLLERVRRLEAKLETTAARKDQTR